jgi:hypothetical protein
MNLLRLNRMMSSRRLPQAARKRLAERLIDANVGPDDPMSTVLLVEANIEQAAQDLASLPDRMTDRLRNDLADSNSALVAGLRDTVRTTLRQTSAQAIREARRNSALHLAAACILGGTAIGGLGVAVGAQLGQDRRASFLETLAAMPQAEGWTRLMASNPQLMDRIWRECVPGSSQFLPQTNGRPACHVPLWTGEAPPPPPASFPARLHAEITHLVAVTPAWLVLLVGILATLTAQPLLRWILTDNSKDGAGT